MSAPTVRAIVADYLKTGGFDGPDRPAGEVSG